MVASPLRTTVDVAAVRGRDGALQPLGRHLVGRTADQAAQLALVRRDDRGRGALGEQLQLGAERVQPVGVEQQRDVDAEQLAHERLGAVGAAEPGADGGRLELPGLLEERGPGGHAELAVLARHRDGDHLGVRLLRAGAVGQRDVHQAGAAPEGRERGHVGGALHALRPAGDEHRPDRPLVVERPLGDHQLAHRLVGQQPHLGILVAQRRDADGRHDDLTGERAAGGDEVSDLGGVQRRR